MATAIQTIQAQFLAARKARSTDTAILSTLVGAIEKRQKDQPDAPLGDAEVLGIVRSTLGGVRESLAAKGISPEFRAKMAREEEVLYALLPAQMDEAAILAFAQAEIARQDLAGKPIGPAKGAIMNALKKAHAGSYDGAVAARAVQAALQAHA